MTQLSKGDSTREAVLREALAQASRVGLRGITIGSLAEATGTPKSAVGPKQDWARKAFGNY